MIPVTKTFVPPLNEYTQILKRAFDRGWLTNRGELVKELEQNIQKNIGVNHVLMMNNGTLPIQIALKLLAGMGEVITTPFSYVATTSSILWENCTPVFVDIDPNYLTIDETKIEAKITKKTTCILATHVFGNACNVKVIEKIAAKHNISVIYDAAHCYGVNYLGQSIFNYGNVSTCSMHATKIFHTGEGGAFISNDKELMHKAFLAHNFGHEGFENFEGIGINGKMSEMQAAMGLTVLPYFQEIKGARKKVVDQYRAKLSANFQMLKLREELQWNYSYFPVIFPSEKALLEILTLLKEVDVFPRRYFYPSLNNLPYLDKQDAPISDDISSRIACLPLYVGLTEQEINVICNIMNGYANSWR